MFLSTHARKNLIRLGFVALGAFFASFVAAADARGGTRIVVDKKANLGVIKGIVRDDEGSPIADAVVAIYRVGASKILKEVRSASDGSFFAKVIPGTYRVLAVAVGYNPMTISEVQVSPAAEINYGFKLERSGSGNTLPEKRADRRSNKWMIRAAQQMNRSIYQAQEGATPPQVVESKSSDETTAQNSIEESVGVSSRDEEISKRRAQSVVETYFAGSSEGSYQGFNFATLQPLSENTEIIIAGQTGTGNSAPQRLEATLKTRPDANHQIRVTASGAKLGAIKDSKKQLGQVSLQALDEWRMPNGVILVFGFDYSRFVGAGNDSAISPRFGLQFDADSKTRFHTAYAMQNEERTWSRAVEFEDSTIFFREPLAAPQSVAVEDEKPVMNKSRRLEFGVERVLSDKSNLEGTVFFDMVSGRGIGLVNVPLDALSSEGFAPFTVAQHGKTQGVRFLYSRRFGKTFSASAGYAFGSGQKLSPEAISNPGNVFENALFQSFAAQLNTDLKTGTQIKTVFRLSPQATVFAIDPFQGRLAIYDPGLSILITQSLPTLGLPIRAEAIFDAQNVLDSQTSVNTEQGTLRLNSQRRILRGGISVRF